MKRTPLLIIAAVLVALAATAYSQMIILSGQLGGPPPVICPAGATCTYFSQEGSDSSGDGSIGNPYQSVSKLEAIIDAGSVAPGTHFLFKGGDIWTQQEIDIGTFGHQGLQGVAGNPIVIGSYNGQALFDEQNQTPYCVNVQVPSHPVNYLTINNIGCTRAEHQGISFQQSGSSGLQGITINNNLIYDTGPGCGHMSNAACVGFESEAVWTAKTAYKSAASCNNSDPNSQSCGWIETGAGSGGGTRFMELVTSCTSGTATPNWTVVAPNRGNIFTEATTTGTTKCQWENMGVTTGYANQLNFFDSGDTPHGVMVTGNTVKWGGGHNLLQTDGDTGQGLVMNNKVGPGCPHVCIDSKLSGNYAAAGNTTSVLNHAITWPGNVFQVVNNTVQCGFATGICGRNGSNGLQVNYGADEYFTQNAERSAGAVNVDVLWQGNVGWDVGVSPAFGHSAAGLNLISNGLLCSGGQCPIVTRVYNNTFYASPTCGAGCIGIAEFVGAAGGAQSLSQVDVRNNIIDGFQTRTLDVSSGMTGTTGGVSSQEDYNNFGGAQGNGMGIIFNGSTTPHSHDWCASGCGGNTNINPTYVSASETSSADFRLLAGSPMLGKGLGTLTDATSNIGFYFGTGQ